MLLAAGTGYDPTATHFIATHGNTGNTAAHNASRPHHTLSDAVSSTPTACVSKQVHRVLRKHFRIICHSSESRLEPVVGGIRLRLSANGLEADCKPANAGEVDGG